MLASHERTLLILALAFRYGRVTVVIKVLALRPSQCVSLKVNPIFTRLAASVSSVQYSEEFSLVL